jgi:hypothetical protein
VTNAKKFRERLIDFLVASGSAAFAAYSMAHVAHHSLGIPSADLRNQALVSAVLLIGLMAVEFIVTKER